MEEPTVKTTSAMIGNVPMIMFTEIVKGEHLDTQVKIGEHTICWITGSEREEFAEAINDVIDKYRI